MRMRQIIHVDGMCNECGNCATFCPYDSRQVPGPPPPREEEPAGASAGGRAPWGGVGRLRHLYHRGGRQGRQVLRPHHQKGGGEDHPHRGGPASDEQQEAFVYAFGAVGAVQCGFCIPGMVMAGKALIDQNPDPTEDQIKKAIRGNVCRCTGYKKIIEGIPWPPPSSAGRRTSTPSWSGGDDYGVGDRAFRTDVRRKVLGYGEYCDDIDDGRHGPRLRRPLPVPPGPRAGHRRLQGPGPARRAGRPHRRGRAPQQGGPHPAGLGRDDRQGRHHPLRGRRHLPGGGRGRDDAGRSQEAGERSTTSPWSRCAPSRRPWRRTPPGSTPTATSASSAMSPGDAKTALANSKYVVTQSYQTPFTEHAFLEPECAVAFPYKDGVKVYTSDQGVYDTRKEIAIMLGWEPERCGGEQARGRRLRRQGGRVRAAPGRAGRPEGGPPGEGPASPARSPSTSTPSATIWRAPSPWAATRTASSPAWTARSTSTPAPTPPCAARCWSGPAPTRWAPTATRTPTSGASATTPTTPAGGLPRASACARASSPWSPTSTCWPRRWASPLGDPLPQRHRARQGAAQRPDRRLLHRPQGDPAGGQGRL